MSEGSRNWIFYGELEGRAGQIYRVQMLDAADTVIKRHRKIKTEAIPMTQNGKSTLKNA